MSSKLSSMADNSGGVGIIYLIENKHNGNKYVGQTKGTLNKRWQEHIRGSLTPKGTPSERPLYRALRKYSADAFRLKVLQECPSNQLNEREKHWIEHYDSYNNGYNANTGGDVYEIKQEVKDRIAQTQRDNGVKSDSMINKMTNSLNDKIKNKERWGFMLPENRGSGIKRRMKVRAIHSVSGEIREYDSVRECAIGLTGDIKQTGNCSRSITHKWKVRGWSLSKINPISASHSVIGIDKKTGIQRYSFESIRAVGRHFGSSGSGCYKSLKNKGINSYKGCYWYYAML